MSKEIVNNFLLFTAIVVYGLVFILCCYGSWIEDDLDDKANAIGCAVIMVLIPLIVGGFWWYINLPDKVLR